MTLKSKFIKFTNINSVTAPIQLFAFAVVFFLLFIYTYYTSSGEQFYDSDYYISIANELFNDGGFSFKNFPNSFRGYAYPTIIQVLSYCASIVSISPVSTVYMLNCVMVALIITVILPKTFSDNVFMRRYIFGVLLQFGFVMLFWSDYLSYSLSDIPAMFFLLCGVYFIKRILFYNEYKICVQTAIFSFLAGFFLYTAYNTRTIYLYTCILLLIYAYVYIVKVQITEAKSSVSNKTLLLKSKLPFILFLSATFLLGFAISSFPQMFINFHHTGNITPRVLTENLINNSVLENMQVFWGLDTPRYETYVGSLALFEYAGVHFVDTLSAELILKEGITLENFQLFTIIELLFKYPAEIISIYTRHIISALTPIYSEIYITNMYVDKTLTVVVNIFAWITAGVCHLSSWKTGGRAFYKKYGWLLFCILVSCILVLAGALEIRFFIILHFLLYFYLGFIADYKSAITLVKKHWFAVVFICLGIALLWLSTVSQILSYSTSSNPIFISSTEVESSSTHNTASDP